MRVVISLELQLFESSWDLVQQFNAVYHRKAAGETIVLIVLVTDGSLTKHKNFIHSFVHKSFRFCAPAIRETVKHLLLYSLVSTLQR